MNVVKSACTRCATIWNPAVYTPPDAMAGGTIFRWRIPSSVERPLRIKYLLRATQNLRCWCDRGPGIFESGCLYPLSPRFEISTAARGPRSQTSSALMVMSMSQTSRKEEGMPYRIDRQVVLGLILLIAIAFRFYDLRSIPPGFFVDEAMEGNQALE